MPFTPKLFLYEFEPTSFLIAIVFDTRDKHKIDFGAFDLQTESPHIALFCDT